MKKAYGTKEIEAILDMTFSTWVLAGVLDTVSEEGEIHKDVTYFRYGGNFFCAGGLVDNMGDFLDSTAEYEYEEDEDE